MSEDETTTPAPAETPADTLPPAEFEIQAEEAPPVDHLAPYRHPARVVTSRQLTERREPWNKACRRLLRALEGIPGDRAAVLRAHITRELAPMYAGVMAEVIEMDLK